MQKRLYTLGACCFASHFFVEAATFLILTRYSSSPLMWTLALLYDFFAFVPQGVYGALRDKLFPRVDFSLIGGVFMAAAAVMAHFGAPLYAVGLVLAVGNGMLHVHAAEETLRRSPGRVTPAALFVSGGSFGLITGRLLCSAGVPVLWALAFTLLAVLCCRGADLLCLSAAPENLQKYRFAAENLPLWELAGLAVLVVAVRAYMGYGIPTAWNKTTAQTVALYAFMGVGKALGGIVTDRFGVRTAAVVSTLPALPFLLFGNRIMAVSLFGVMLFSMTMAVTLAVLVSVMPQSPGIAFGFTTLGLALGTFPIFVYKTESFAVNCVTVSVLSVVCFFILLKICAKEKSKHV